MEDTIVELFAVQNKYGKWYRAKGYAGTGETWVDEIRSARIYSKEAPAKRAVSFFANKYPNHEVPDIVKLVVTRVEVVDQRSRVRAQQEKKKRQKLIKKANKKKAEIAAAQKKLEEAQQELQKLNQIGDHN